MYNNQEVENPLRKTHPSVQKDNSKLFRFL
jgi:hypothetical protein